jgi:2-polyprenyl-3-methyl-5-hydroxy-6-metoxy-1,4-benzoquinol methylase
MSPVSNANLSEEQLDSMEPFFPLHARVCSQCLLVQLQEHQSPSDLFDSNYAYFSSYSDSWLEHAKKYTELMTSRFGLDEKSQVVEIASNDGYLLQYFNELGIPVLGIEPASNVANVAVQKGIATWTKFFGVKTAKELVKKNLTADLLLGNNVLAHVPDLNDFVGGMKIALSPDGVITMEFPHILQQIINNQFDTIYHEHYSYLSLLTVQTIFEHHGLKIFDVDVLSTHGGALRIYAKHSASEAHSVKESVKVIIDEETAAGLADVQTYENFSQKAEIAKRNLLTFLIEKKNEGKTIAAYGAAAKGNTLLNYCGIGKDFISFAVDKSPHKQGKYLPGTHIPVLDPSVIFTEKPDFLLILPWNLKDEIIHQLTDVRSWGCKFVVPIPEVEVL